MFQEVLDAGALRRSIRELPWQAVTRFDRAEDEEKTLPPQNLALCSRVPWQEAWEVNFEKLPLTLDRPVRGFLGVEWKTQRQGSWTAYVVHLKSNRGGREVTSKRRERAIEYLRQDWQRRGLMPDTDAIAVGGDFKLFAKKSRLSEGRKQCGDFWGKDGYRLPMMCRGPRERRCDRTRRKNIPRPISMPFCFLQDGRKRSARRDTKPGYGKTQIFPVTTGRFG